MDDVWIDVDQLSELYTGCMMVVCVVSSYRNDSALQTAVDSALIVR